GWSWRTRTPCSRPATGQRTCSFAPCCRTATPQPARCPETSTATTPGSPAVTAAWNRQARAMPITGHLVHGFMMGAMPALSGWDACAPRSASGSPTLRRRFVARVGAAGEARGSPFLVVLDGQAVGVAQAFHLHLVAQGCEGLAHTFRHPFIHCGDIRLDEAQA